MIKRVIRVFKEINRHWVGDGFYVYGLLRPDNEINKANTNRINIALR